MLEWEERIQFLKNVATRILYLHEGWEVKVFVATGIATGRRIKKENGFKKRLKSPP